MNGNSPLIMSAAKVLNYRILLVIHTVENKVAI